MALYEKALSRFPDHPTATVALSEILLDIYCQKIPAEVVDPDSLLPPTFPTTTKNPASKSTTPDPLNSARQAPPQNHVEADAMSPNPSTPEELNRLAARDRAYSLLSSLTKLGSGWDYPEAWFALARAYEEGGQIDKAKEVLWWTVELEDSRPIRGWDCIALGSGVL